MKSFVLAALAAATIAVTPAPALAFLHNGHAAAHSSHHKGCFVTASPQHNTKGIRQWRNPCPHHERKHLNPYHPGYHRPDRPHPAPH